MSFEIWPYPVCCSAFRWRGLRRVNAELRTPRPPEGGTPNRKEALAEETAIPYRNLINLYFRECAQTAKEPDLSRTS